jgi:hypothetical protein
VSIVDTLDELMLVISLLENSDPSIFQYKHIWKHINKTVHFLLSAYNNILIKSRYSFANNSTVEIPPMLDVNDYPDNIRLLAIGKYQDYIAKQKYDAKRLAENNNQNFKNQVEIC